MSAAERDRMERALELLMEAIEYEAEAFDSDSAVDGAELVEFFGQWRTRARHVVSQMS
jgi:hypothetical protein